MKGKMLDLYERWDESGHLEVKLKATSEMISKRATQKQIAEYLGLNDGDPIKYDLNFLCRANPGRGNAYRFSTTIDELKDEYKALLVVLELNTNIGGLDDRIGYIHLQFKNTKNLKVGATVTLRNNLETQREDALKLLTKTFSEFKRDNYDQEGWNQIHEIYRNT